MPSFGLRAIAAGKWTTVDLSPDEHDRALAAKNTLVAGVRIEAKWAMLVANYREWEGNLLDLSLRDTLYSPSGWSALTEELYEATRLLVNLMLAARLYTDQACHDISTICGRDSAELLALKNSMAKEYDQRLGYRALEALRNYTQHRALPFKGITIGWRRETVHGREVALHASSLQFDPAEIDSSGFKQSVLTELRSLAPPIDFSQLVRDYVEGVVQIHGILQSLLSTRLANCEGELNELKGRITRVAGQEVQHIAIVAIADDGMRHTEDIFDDLIYHRKWLANRTDRARVLASQRVWNETSRP